GPTVEGGGPGGRAGGDRGGVRGPPRRRPLGAGAGGRAVTAGGPTGAPWGGRFSEAADRGAQAFTASLPFDHRLWPFDLQGSEAWARALATSGVLAQAELDAILGGLAAVRAELEGGTFPFRIELEDIHMNIERRLIETIGPVAGKLHTGRSRNDQIAVDMRLWIRAEIAAIQAALRVV